MESEVRAALLLAVATFSTFLSANLVEPVQPVLAEELGGSYIEVVGVLMVGIAALSLLQPLGGALADRYCYLGAIAAGGALATLVSLAYPRLTRSRSPRAIGGVRSWVLGRLPHEHDHSDRYAGEQEGCPPRGLRCRDGPRASGRPGPLLGIPSGVGFSAERGVSPLAASTLSRCP